SLGHAAAQAFPVHAPGDVLGERWQVVGADGIGHDLHRRVEDRGAFPRELRRVSAPLPRGDDALEPELGHQLGYVHRGWCRWMAVERFQAEVAAVVVHAVEADQPVARLRVFEEARVEASDEQAEGAFALQLVCHATRVPRGCDTHAMVTARPMAEDDVAGAVEAWRLADVDLRQRLHLPPNVWSAEATARSDRR